MIPEISIIIPCYNQACFLEEALLSVLNQTIQDWECIIVNDGSIDDTGKIAKNWTEKDKRFKYLHQDNNGLSNARNNGISASIAKYILPLDADDKIAPNYLQNALKMFESNNDLKLVYCQAMKFGVENEIWGLPEFSLERLKLSNIIFCSAIFKKSDWIKIGGYDENLKNGWEDWDFWISLLKTGGKVKQLDLIGFYYRVKYDSMVIKMDDEIRDMTFRYINKKHLDFFKITYKSFNDRKQVKKSRLQNFVELLRQKIRR